MSTIVDLQLAIEKIQRASCPAHGSEHLEICTDCLDRVTCNGYWKDRWKDNNGSCLGVCYCTCED